MRKTNRLPERHIAMLSRLCDLAHQARLYAGVQNESDRMRYLRILAEAALSYSASVRTMARSK